MGWRSCVWRGREMFERGCGPRHDRHFSVTNKLGAIKVLAAIETSPVLTILSTYLGNLTICSLEIQNDAPPL